MVPPGDSTSSFYRNTKMGEGFDHNPVLEVQERQLAEIASEVPAGARALDLGCGAGTTTNRLLGAAPSFDVVGADLSPTAVETYRAVTGRPAVRLSATSLPFAAAAFDLVVSDDVIEHLVNTDDYAREVHRVLRPGGWLLLSTPNLAAWFNRAGLLVGLQPAFSEVSFERVFGRPGEEIVGHLRLFTSKSIVQFLTYHGFEVVDLSGARFDAIRGPAGMVDRFAQRFPSIAGNSAVVARKPRRP